MNQFSSTSSIKPPRVRRMALEVFRNWKPADGWKYVWDNGIITKDKKMVSEKQLFIINNLVRAFHKTQSYQNGCEFIPEVEMPTLPNRIRIPDLSFYTPTQLRAKHEGADTDRISEFVVVVISLNDSAYSVESKLWEYFSVGVQAVWHIFPEHKIVKIYTSPRDMTICTENDICNASPVLSEFKISVSNVFKQP